MNPEVVIVGSYVQDHAWQVDAFPATGETRRALRFSTGPGGKGFNQAVASHRMGARTLFVGAVGADSLGDTARRFASEQGLTCAWQVLDGVPTAASSIVVDAQGSNRIAVFLGANERLDPAFLDRCRDRFRSARVVLVQLENDLEIVRRALGLAGEVGAMRVLNPAPMHPELTGGMLALCDLVTPNESEFSQMLARFADTSVPPERVAASSADALHVWCRKLDVPTVVLTLGEHGCFVSHAESSPLRRGESSHYRLAGERVDTVDTTGAGDAFSGALAAALARLGERPFREAALNANRAAALSTETAGTAPAMPRSEDLAHRFPGR